MRPALLAASLLVAAASARAAYAPRVVLQTDAGDVVVALDPSAAPRHVKRTLALVRAGSYDATAVRKLADEYVALSPARAGGQRPLPPEPSALHHIYGTVTVARSAASPDPTDTSLAILLAAAPSMDGRFTAIGRVESGFDVLDALRSQPRGADGRPLRSVAIRRALALETPTELAAYAPRPLDRSFLPRGPSAVEKPGAWLAVMLAGAAGFFLVIASGRMRAAWAPLLVVLVGFFGAFLGYAPSAQSSSWLGLALLAGALAVFRLMSMFEAASR